MLTTNITQERSFEDTLKALTSKELILVMVESLRNPKTQIKMDTFGSIYGDGICYGCAATNTILYLTGKDATDDVDPKDLDLLEHGECVLMNRKDVTGYHNIMYFETAIDAMRSGDLQAANMFLYKLKVGFEFISNPADIELPYLDDYYTEEELDVYVQLAHSQPEDED